MKKALSLIMLIAVALSFTACAKGKSVPVDSLKQSNKVGALLSSGTVAYTEKTEYFSDGETLAYELYYEIADGASYTYNVAETIGDFSHYIREGKVYSQKDGSFCQVVFSNPALTYAKYINEYIDADFPLDMGERYQLSSEVKGDFTYVTYYATVTPQMASKIYSVTLSAGEKIISSYKIDERRRIYSVEYSVENAEGEMTKVACRTFEYFDQKQNKFDGIPKSTGDVTIEFVINGNKYKRTASDGINIIFEDGGAGYEYFQNEDMTQKYVPGDAENITVYVKTEQN